MMRRCGTAASAGARRCYCTMSMLDKPLPAAYAYGDEVAKPMKTDANDVAWTGQPSPYQKRNRSNQANQLPRGWFDEDERRGGGGQHQRQMQEASDAQEEVKREVQKGGQVNKAKKENDLEACSLGGLFFALDKNRYKQFDDEAREVISILDVLVTQALAQKGAGLDLSRVVKAAVGVGNLQYAERVIERAEEAGCPAFQNAVTHQRIMSTFAGAGHFEGVKRAHQRMQKAGGTTNVVTYNIVLNCFASMRDEKRALSLLKTIEDDGFTPDKVSFNTAIRACSTVETALAVYRQLLARDFAPDRYTLLGLIEVCSACEDEDAAELAMVELESKGVPRQAASEAVLLLKAKFGNVSEVLKIYSEMQKDGKSSTPEVVEAILGVCVPLVTSSEDKYFAFVDNLWRDTWRPAARGDMYLRSRKTRDLMRDLYTRLDMPKEARGCFATSQGSTRLVCHNIMTQ